MKKRQSKLFGVFSGKMYGISGNIVAEDDLCKIFLERKQRRDRYV